jgi:hypothetical protein
MTTTSPFANVVKAVDSIGLQMTIQLCDRYAPVIGNSRLTAR